MENRRNNTIKFFIFSFIWTWIVYFAIILLQFDPYQGTGMVLLICGGCSPTFVGFLLAMVTYNKDGRRDYIKRLYQVKGIKLKWWLFIVLIFPAIFAMSIGIDMITGGNLPEMTKLRAIIANPVVFLPLFLLSFMSGPFSEELGWRGFALNPMLSRFGFTKASVLLGAIWGLWHLPLYFMPQTWHGKMGFALPGFWMFMLFSIGLSLMMSWVYIRTGRSILAAVLMHLFSNFTAQLLEMVSPNAELLKGVIVFIVGAAIAVYAITKKKDAPEIYKLTIEQ